MANVNNDRRKPEPQRNTIRQNNVNNNRNNNNTNNTTINDNNNDNNNNNINNKPRVVGKSVPRNQQQPPSKSDNSSSSAPTTNNTTAPTTHNNNNNTNKQQQKKKPSLVREGIDSNNKPIPKPRPKVQQQQTPRVNNKGPSTNNRPNPGVRHRDDDNTTTNNRHTMRDGDDDSLMNNNHNKDGDGGSVNLSNSVDYPSNESNHQGTKAPTKQRGAPKGGNKGNPSDIPSVRQRYYESADMDDVLQDKIAHQLRENGVSETKVAYLSAKIAQAVRDDVMMERKTSAPTVVSNLSSAISDHLDVILHNSRQHTDLSHIKPHDASQLSQIVLTRVAQVHEELDECKGALDKALQSSKKHQQQQPAKDNNNHRDVFHATAVTDGDGGGDEAPGANSNTTPRDPRDRSMVVAIKEGIDQHKTHMEIAVEQLTELQRNREDVDQMTHKHGQEIQAWDDENLTLKKYLTEADQDNETLVAKVKEQQHDNDKLNKTLQTSRKEVERLQKQIDDLVAQGYVSGKELAGLQSEKARLQVLCDQRYKEILHLRDPDKDLLQQIRALKDEVTSLRTQTRRLTEEKGMLRAKTQKMEVALDESLKQRNKVSTERDGLFKENQDIRQKYRKLTLATPAQRTLPEIMTPRTRSTSRNTTLLMSTRTNSRADSSVPGVKNSLSEDSTNKLPTHEEELMHDDPAHI